LAAPYTAAFSSVDRLAILGSAMKTDIHPNYVEAHVTCTCGNSFTTRSTKPEIHVEICAECHPFYTGKQKLVDTGGRVERFQRRAAKGRAAARQTANA
jgi:large subunit ribosomal protein L31